MKVVDGRILKATKIGQVKGKFKVFDKLVDFNLEDVFYVKDMDRNLLSFAKVTDKNKIVSIGNSCSKVAKVYLINSKDEVYEKFNEYINSVENKFDKKIKKLRCGNGTEYLNKNMYRLFREKGIECEPCPPYVHKLNGTAERYNRSIMDSARCLLAESKVEKRYWPEVVYAAAYLKNRTIANTLERNKSPYEIMFNENPDLKYLKLYGSKVFIRVPECY